MTPVQDNSNGITRREFEAVLAPLKEDVTEMKDLMKDAVKKMDVFERRMAFAQGAVSAMAFVVGSGVLTMVVLAVLTWGNS